ncbi:transposase [Streptomyces sp. MW-W600-10]|nr:transposase [Streptomyces sp. MW-W600-10]
MRIWLEIVSLARDLLAWMPMLASTGDARRWEPKKLRLRLFSVAAQLVNTGRRRRLRLPDGPGPPSSAGRSSGSTLCRTSTDQPHRLSRRPAPPHRRSETRCPSDAEAGPPACPDHEETAPTTEPCQ